MGRKKANKADASTQSSEFASVRLGFELKKRLENMADEEDRSLSSLIRRILERHVSQKALLGDSAAVLARRIASESKSMAEEEDAL
jgi:predicted DNA-binding protein